MTHATTPAPPPIDSEPLQAVIFDVDGTLADTEPEGHRVAFNKAFEEFGLDWYWPKQLYGELLQVTGGKERIRHYIAGGAPLPELGGRIDLDTLIARLHALKSEIYSAMVLSGRIPLRPGVARLLGELRAAGVRPAIATTTTPSSLASLIRANFGGDLGAIFDVVGAGDVVPHKKPAPDIYHWVLKRLELPASACLVIEDSAAGLAAASAAGLATVITASTYTANDDFTGALAVVSDLGEPDAPLRRIAGAAVDGPCITLDHLRAWHGLARAKASRPPGYAAAA